MVQHRIPRQVRLLFLHGNLQKLTLWIYIQIVHIKQRSIGRSAMAVKELWGENCSERDDFDQLDIVEIESKSTVLMNRDHRRAAFRHGKSLKVSKGGTSLIVLLKLAVAALLGDPSLFISTMFQFYQK
ncbi:hypothetical protein V6N13_091975 [Hibiscus sabdariffa]|uniref:Uncharacterized protein n=1 Tax=Hibiscus sabdariffa TaxID=183260 RepID=A0ABR2QFL7_9ROSI